MTAITSIIGGGISLATQILKRSNDAQDKKYIDEYIDAEKKLLAERAKPMGDQWDNVVEHYEAMKKILFEAAEKAYLKQVGS